MGLPFQHLVSNSTPGALYDFKENERLRLIVYNIGHHNEYEKMKQLEAKKAETEALAFGDQVASLETSFRLGGISIDCVVLGRSNAPDSPVIQNHVTPATPAEQLTTVRFQMPSIETIHSRNMWQYQQGIDSEKTKNGYPFTVNILPKISQEAANINGTRIPVKDLTEIQATVTDEGMKAVAAEANRLAEWKSVIEFFRSVSEEQAKTYMFNLMASWAGIVHRDELGAFTTVLPSVGTIWEVGVNGPSYVRPLPFRWEKGKGTIWNVGFNVTQNPQQAMVLKEKLRSLESPEHTADDEAW